ncbi:AAA family ATPase [Aerococcus urinaeequi]|uniref:AAA family ATPase n=1 Tax=Aerococcus urinaeequi TaxID=51665 RepID=UPI003D6B9F92
MIKKIILKNFKSLKDTEINCNNGTNILVGENNAGKTTILQAINLVLNGSYSQIAKNNLSSLFNTNVVSNFLNEKNIKNLPEVRVEIYLDESNPLVANNFDLEGNHNSLNEKQQG